MDDGMEHADRTVLLLIAMMFLVAFVVSLLWVRVDLLQRHMERSLGPVQERQYYE